MQGSGEGGASPSLFSMMFPLSSPRFTMIRRLQPSFRWTMAWQGLEKGRPVIPPPPSRLDKTRTDHSADHGSYCAFFPSSSFPQHSWLSLPAMSSQRSWFSSHPPVMTKGGVPEAPPTAYTGYQMDSQLPVPPSMPAGEVGQAGSWDYHASTATDFPWVAWTEVKCPLRLRGTVMGRSSLATPPPCQTLESQAGKLVYPFYRPPPVRGGLFQLGGRGRRSPVHAPLPPRRKPPMRWPTISCVLFGLDCLQILMWATTQTASSSLASGREATTGSIRTRTTMRITRRMRR